MGRKKRGRKLKHTNKVKKVINEHINSRVILHHDTPISLIQDNFNDIYLDCIIQNYVIHPQHTSLLNAKDFRDRIKDNLARGAINQIKDRMVLRQSKNRRTMETIVHGILFVAKKGEVEL